MGMKPDKGQVRDWHEIFFLRLAGKYDKASESADTTKEAEQSQGLTPSVYFYVGRACPEYGHRVAAYVPPKSTMRKVSVSPFDTGAVHSKYIAVRYQTRPATNQEKRQFISNNSFDLNNYLPKFDQWIQRGYQTGIAGYIDDQHPSCHYCDDTSSTWIDVANSPEMDDRGWTWEVRMGKTPRGTDGYPAVEHVWLSQPEYAELRNYANDAIKEGGRLGIVPADWEHLRDELRHIMCSTTSAAEDANKWLKKVEQ